MMWCGKSSINNITIVITVLIFLISFAQANCFMFTQDVNGIRHQDSTNGTIQLCDYSDLNKAYADQNALIQTTLQAIAEKNQADTNYNNCVKSNAWCIDGLPLIVQEQKDNLTKIAEIQTTNADLSAKNESCQTEKGTITGSFVKKMDDISTKQTTIITLETEWLSKERTDLTNQLNAQTSTNQTTLKNLLDNASEISIIVQGIIIIIIAYILFFKILPKLKNGKKIENNHYPTNIGNKNNPIQYEVKKGENNGQPNVGSGNNPIQNE